VVDVDEWYTERDGKAAINYGASSGHMPARQRVMHDMKQDITPVGDAAHRPATEQELQEIIGVIEQGLEQGALAVGLGVQYTPGASRWEILEVFRLAANHGATCHVHMRGMGHREPESSVDGLGELIAASAITGASVHVVHISSNGLRATPLLLQTIGEARSRGMDVTTECYPYDAALTALESAIFDEGWREKLGIDYQDLEWTPTGERLTASTFAEYREIGGMVVLHMIPEDSVVAAVASPLTMIASDGWLKDGKGHPRTAGSYSRVLGRFVREDGVLTLMDALRKMSLMPAQRLEGRTPAMRNKGRVQVGADADLAIFDPERVIDRATYDAPTKPPEGIVHVLVHGEPVVRDGRLHEGATPGRPVRAPVT
jgi:dihydroorotase